MSTVTAPSEAPPPRTLVKSFTTSSNDTRSRLKWYLIIGVVGVILTMIGLSISGQRNSSGNPLLFASCIGGMMTMFAVFAVVLAIPRLLRRRETLELYEDGFVLKDTTSSNVKRAALWSEVTDITRPNNAQMDGMAGAFGAAGLVGMVAGAALGAAMNTSIQKQHERLAFINLQRQSKIRVDERFPDLDVLTHHLRELAVNAWEAEAIAVVEAGRTHEVGAFKVSQSGIHTRNKFASWDSIRSMNWFDNGLNQSLMVNYDEAGKSKLQNFTVPIGSRGEVVMRLGQRYAPNMPKKPNLSKPI